MAILRKYQGGGGIDPTAFQKLAENPALTQTIQSGFNYGNTGLQASSANTLANQNTRNIAPNIQSVDENAILKSSKKSGMGSGMSTGASIGGSVGSIIGSLVPGVGTAVVGGAGALVGGAIGGLIGRRRGSKEGEEAVDAAKTQQISDLQSYQAQERRAKDARIASQYGFGKDGVKLKLESVLSGYKGK